MGLNLSVNILTSGFLVTVVIFLVVMGILFVSASTKMKEVLERGDPKTNNQQQLKSAYDSIRVAYILIFIAAALSLLLAILYAGHETVIAPSEFWHLALYLITYILLIVSVIYAYVALNKLYDLRIENRNGADAFIWAGMLMGIFAFVGLTATGTGRLGMNIARSGATKRLNEAEKSVKEHLPAIREQLETHLPTVRAKVDELHADAVAKSMEDSTGNIVSNSMANPSGIAAMMNQMAPISSPGFKYQSFAGADDLQGFPRSALQTSLMQGQ